MPVTAPQLAPSILTQLNSRGIVGAFATNLASGVAQGIQSFISSLVVQGQAIGTLGSGTGTGKWTLNPVLGSQIINTNLEANVIPGYNKPKLAQGIAFGAANVINTSAVVQTTVVGVAIGIENGVIANPDPIAAASFIYSGLTSNAIVGTKATNMASGLGQGVAQWFTTGAIVNSVAGVPVFPFPPSAGIGTGRIS